MSFYPKSFSKLVIFGFALVALPLIFALVYAALYVDHLAGQSRQAVYAASQTTQSSRMLVEQLLAMERQARQFQVLGDVTLLQAYAATHVEFQHTVEQFAAQSLDAYQQRQLKILADKEQEVFATLQRHPPEAAASEAARREFTALATMAQALLAQSSKLIDREVTAMQQTASKAQRTLMWQALALIPGSVLLATIFFTLIARPIRQIDHVIRRLGEGDLTSDVYIKGPRDLEYLGKRLNWLRHRLLELEEEKNKFLRHMSHELKTPLTAIREGTALLTEEVVGPLQGPQREIANILHQNSLHLQRLIEDLLHFSMVHSRSVQPDLQVVRLDRLIAEVCINHKVAMMAKELDFECNSMSLAVLGDTEKLRTVIDNLLSNAVKFSPARGRIRLALAQQNGCAILEIQDSGPGIKPHERNRIFEPFYQGQALSVGHVQGTGLGLSIVKEYLLMHRGTIEIVDEGSQGAHFRVTLPIRQG